MQRIRDSDGATENRFIEGDPRTGEPPTRVRAYWLNTIQEEIATAITKSGLLLDETKNDQLHLAIKKTSAHDIIIEHPEELKEALLNVRDGSSIYVKPFEWSMESTPLRLTANSIRLEFSPATKLIGRSKVEGEEGGLNEGEGILEVTGSDCTILGGRWDFNDDPQNKFHAVKFTQPEATIRPYFGLSRIKSGLLNSTTIPLNTVLNL